MKTGGYDEGTPVSGRREGVRGGHLNAPVPLWLPRVRNDETVALPKRLVLAHVHRTDKLRAVHLLWWLA